MYANLHKHNDVSVFKSESTTQQLEKYMQNESTKHSLVLS